MNPARFKNPKAGMAISAAAGPVSNLLLAFAATIVYKLVLFFYPALPGGIFRTFCICSPYMVLMNVSLAVFNLDPAAPAGRQPHAVGVSAKAAVFQGDAVRALYLFAMAALLLLGGV